jgi:hypothetical protein
MAFYIIGPSATELFGLSFVIDFSNLEFTLVEYDNHEVIESPQHLELFASVVGDDAVCRGFLVVEFHKFEVVFGTICGNQAVHWVEIISAELFDCLNHDYAVPVVGQSAVKLCHVPAAQENDASFLTANHHKSKFIVFP